MSEDTRLTAHQGPGCKYLVCHGEVQVGAIAVLAGTTVGVYTEIGDPLAWRDARNILKLGLNPIYRPVQGEFPEYQLSSLSRHESAMWDKYAAVSFGDPDVDFLQDDQTLSSYLGTFSQSRPGRELRLLACAGLSRPAGKPRKLLAPASWRAEAIVSQTNGTLFELRTAEDAKERRLLDACAKSWDEALGILSEADKDLISAFALDGGPSMLAVKVWEAWKKKPEQPEHITDWLDFLEVLTPDKDAAQDLYQAWQRARGDCGSLGTVLGDICQTIDQMLASAEQPDEIYKNNPCAAAFRDSGWAKRTAELGDLEDELTAELLPDETGQDNTATTGEPTQQVPVPPAAGQDATLPGLVPGQPGTSTGERGPGVQMKRAAETSPEVLKDQSEKSGDSPDDT